MPNKFKSRSILHQMALWLALCIVLASLTGCSEILAAWRAGGSTLPPDQTTKAANDNATTTADDTPDGANSTTSASTAPLADKTTQTSDSGSSAATADPSDERLTWQGAIIKVDSGGRSFLALVDEEYQKYLGDKAHVGLYESARVVRDDDGTSIELVDVPAGSRVIVTITGGIRESYPVQVSATEVRVIIKAG